MVDTLMNVQGFHNFLQLPQRWTRITISHMRLGIECSSGVMAEQLPQVTSGPSGGMNQINATRQGVQVNILGSNGAAVGLPMFIPSNQSRQGGQPTQVSP